MGATRRCCHAVSEWRVDVDPLPVEGPWVAAGAAAGQTPGDLYGACLVKARSGFPGAWGKGSAEVVRCKIKHLLISIEPLPAVF